MTELATRATTAPRSGDRAAAGDAPGSVSLWWRGALSALWVVSLGCAALVAVVLVAWAADSRSGASAGSAIRTALLVWLSGHRVPLHVAEGTVGVAPLGMTLVLGLLVARAAAVLARGQGVDDARGVGMVALAVGLPYAVLATFVAAAADSAGVRPDPLVSLAAGLVLGTAAASWGAARGAGLVRSCWSLLPGWSRAPIAAGAAGVGVLLAGSVALLGLSFATHAGNAVRLVDGLGGGAVGVAAVVALDLALVPNAVVCGLGYLAGPGFAVGAGTSVSLGGVHAGALPALPLLAAVPRSPAGAVVEALVVVVLVAAGVAAAAIVAREGEVLTRSMALAAGAGGVAGALAALLAAVAGGPAGPGRMAAFGPSPWQVGLAVAVEVAVVGCGAVGALTWRRGR